MILAALLLSVWTQHVTTDPTTDEREVRAWLSQSGNMLALNCNGGQPFVMLNSAQYLGPEPPAEWREMTYRIDDRSPVTLRWQYSARSAWLEDQPAVHALMSSLASGESVVFRAENYRGGSLDYTFELEPGGIETFRENCGI